MGLENTVTNGVVLNIDTVMFLGVLEFSFLKAEVVYNILDIGSLLYVPINKQYMVENVTMSNIANRDNLKKFTRSIKQSAVLQKTCIDRP